MVKHIVMYSIKSELDKEACVNKIRSLLEPLVGQIPGLQHLEVRQAFAGMDFALYAEFENRETMAGYADHPLHLAAKKQFAHMIVKRVSADYEI